jgi:hypothetical protein
VKYAGCVTGTWRTLGFGRAGGEGILHPDIFEWIGRTVAEIDNIRSALKWSLGDGDIGLGFNIELALFHFWQEVGFVAESIAIYQALLSSPKAAGSAFLRERGMALALLSISHLRLADHLKAIQAANSALAIEARLPDPEIKAFSLMGLGHAYGLEARYPEALGVSKKAWSYSTDWITSGASVGPFEAGRWHCTCRTMQTPSSGLKETAELSGQSASQPTWALHSAMAATRAYIRAIFSALCTNSTNRRPTMQTRNTFLRPTLQHLRRPPS